MGLQTAYFLSLRWKIPDRDHHRHLNLHFDHFESLNHRRPHRKKLCPEIEMGTMNLQQ
jgi:hypothetical protein